jgi:DNA-directed RNA polymerase subunit RPC12/RpoP
VSCPTCGAAVSYDQRLAVLSVCEYCQTAIIYDEKVALIAGKMSVLAKPAGPLFVGAMGSLKKLNFTVIGRVRYGYANGFWDEWYLSHDDGSTSWLTEDEKRFMHEHPRELEIDASSITQFQPGSVFNLGDSQYSVRESDTAICEGGEGQLPFKIISDEHIQFLDLVREDGATATIEVEPGGTVKFFAGESLEFKDIQVFNASGYEDNSVDFEKAATSESRERIAYNTDRQHAIQCHSCGGTNDKVDFSADEILCQHCGVSLERAPAELSCPDCSAHLEIFGSESKSINCSYCFSSISLEGKPTVVAKLKGKLLKNRQKLKIPIALGSKATFDGLKFQLVGFIRTVEDTYYFTYDYLFYNQQWGYRWLSCYDGHFTLQEKMDKPPMIDAKRMQNMRYKQSLRQLDTSWQYYEGGDLLIDWVEGELPWVAQVGDGSTYHDFIAPPQLLSCEITNKEVEWQLYRSIEHDELAKAMGIKINDLPRGRGVGACQVNTKASSQMANGSLAAAFTLVGIILLVMGFSSGKEIANFSVDNKQYREEFISPLYDMTATNANYMIKFQAPLDNAWVYLDWALVNEADEALIESSAEMSYYSGYEGGESWSEGSNKDSVKFHLDKAAKYKLLILGQAGSGETANDVTRGPAVQVRIFQGVQPLLPYILLSLFALAIAAYYLLGYVTFETQRWKHIHEDDD